MSAERLAPELTEAGYDGLFLTGRPDALESAWGGGENRAALIDIAQGDAYPDLARVLASEVLHAKAPEHAPPGDIYARALALSGLGDHPLHFSANLWGFMYEADERGGDAYGTLGPRLLEAGAAAVPALTELLGDGSRLLYVGSQDATLGNQLGYRVKDAAAYYIGKIAGIPVAFHRDPAARDAEIERLRAASA